MVSGQWYVSVLPVLGKEFVRLPLARTRSQIQLAAHFCVRHLFLTDVMAAASVRALFLATTSYLTIVYPI